VTAGQCPELGDERAVAYGGMLGDAAHADLLYAGRCASRLTEHRRHLHAAGGARPRRWRRLRRQPGAAPTAADANVIADIVLDPTTGATPS